nr:MAG TPA: hypothetical protein [Caudoviricetes sp.]
MVGGFGCLLRLVCFNYSPHLRICKALFRIFSKIFSAGVLVCGLEELK